MQIPFTELDLYDVSSLYTEEERMVRDSVRRFVDDRVLPIIEDCNRTATFPKQLIPEMAEMGLLGSNLQGYGCPGLGAVAYGLISDKLFNARRPPANLMFAILELVGLALIFFGPTNLTVLVAGMLLFGMGLTGLVTSLGGLFAVDIAPKRAAGAAMGVIGIFSYIGAGIQEHVSGGLIERGMTLVDGVRHYDFGPAITFWIASSVLSMLLAASLWRTRLRD